MSELKKELLAEKEYLMQIIGKAEAQLEKLPQGKVRVSMKKGKPQFYFTTEEDHHGKYMRKKDAELVQMLIQREYDENLLKQAMHRIPQIDRFIKMSTADELENIYTKMHPAKQALISPIVPEWEVYEKRWLSIPFDLKEFRDGDTMLDTRRGEIVRSKTERTIANLLYEYGIPYKYECPLRLSNFGMVHPDFTVLSRKLRKKMIWEHYGKVDDVDYANKMVVKQQAYEKNGYFVGENMIITQETRKEQLSEKHIRLLIERYLV